MRKASLTNKRVSVNPDVSKVLYTKSKGQTSDTRSRVKKSKVLDGTRVNHGINRLADAIFGPCIMLVGLSPLYLARYPFYYASKEVNVSTQTVMNDDQQTTQLVDESDKGDRVRGPTLMRKIWKQKASFRISITVNEHGQPICKNSSKLTHFLGYLTRSYQFRPVYRPWNQVKKKDALLNYLRTKFDIPPTADSWILQSFCRKMKIWRARIKEVYFDPSLSMEAMTDKNKSNRANKKLMEVIGKKSFARIRKELKTGLGIEHTRVDMFKKCFTNGSADGKAATVLKQMKELTDKLVDGETDTPGPDDVFSQVMGHNNSGSAQKYGLGILAKDLWGIVPGRLVVRKENAQLKFDKSELIDEYSTLKAQLARKNNGSGVENEGSGVHDNGSVIKCLKVRDEVYVKSITNNKVARGKLVSMDPPTVVLQTELGAGWCEVELQVAIERNEVLFRSFEHMRYIHDVIGTSTAWRTTLIELTDFD
ncbi:uncharacterized protein [Rutidosis leptorrhynchoides]|uniref:uncharacterized protein n=1 Tax=Rutidosis leptorrhynchoides TaxID=125765 RepID=UPI003A99C6E7